MREHAERLLAQLHTWRPTVLDNPGNAQHDQPWAHTGLDRAFTNYDNMRKIRMRFPQS